MSDSNAAGPSASDSATFDYYVGHYAAAVGKTLLREGIAVTRFDVEGPMVRDGKLTEGEIWMYLSGELRHKLSPIGECTLDWSESSGWYVERDLAESVTERRYLGHGLVPDPARVAVFATAMQVDPHSAGSLERPYYRSASAPYAELFAQLKPYLPKWRREPEEEFRAGRATYFEGRVATALAADAPGPVVNLVLTPGEFAALELLLEYAGGEFHWGGVEVVEALARDLRDRSQADPARIQEFRTNLELARARVAERRKTEPRDRKDGQD